ncbi:DUF3492 domain-containing protein [Streptomyces sp. CRN 30]|uniref:DUF3492 domain-containing protein n=1 Tax=Streptomyces sp. CRN 30 TaxID=3075613 RepID=UPI002A836919|nr:DUF3492 domain-containing protein [Streptomyces sp. CRN 30]
MRIGLLTEGGYPYASGDARLWCDRLVRGLGQHEFDVYALSCSERQEDEGWVRLPPQVNRVRTAPLWTAVDDGVVHGRRTRRRFTEAYGELTAALCAGGQAGGADGTDEINEVGEATEADRFGNALRALAELARDEGGLVGALRSDAAVRTLEHACRAPGALRAAGVARVPDLLTVTAHLERALRPLSLDWYGTDGLGAVDLCHATAGGAAALPGLLARHFSGVPLLVTEYEGELRARYLRTGGTPPVRALLASFHRRLAAETYRQAACVTPGGAHVRRWQERCGADRARIRTVHPAVEVSRLDDGGGSADRADPYTLVRVGPIAPTEDMVSLLRAFGEIRRSVPRARLRIIGELAEGPAGVDGLRSCEALAGQLCPGDETRGAHAVDDEPVSFEMMGGPGVPGLAGACAAGAVVVLPSAAEGFPADLVEVMFRGRATVSTDTGAVAEVIGDTGLVVPPCEPRALARACVTLLRDPERRARLGAAARARALELFTVERNTAAFRDLYLDTISRSPARREVLDEAGEPLLFGVPAEALVPWRWTRRPSPPTPVVPRWAVATATPSLPATPSLLATSFPPATDRGATPTARRTGEATR